MIRKLWIIGGMMALLGVPVQVASKEMQMLVSWPTTYPVVELTEVYAKNVLDASNGDIKINLRGPESVPSFEQLEPVSAGVFELIFTHPAYHTGTTGFALGLDATDGDPGKRREAGAWEAVDRHYQQKGLKLLSLPVGGREGFMLLLKEPVGADGGLADRKIRAAPIYQPLIESLGGSAVVLPPNEIYAALEKGVVDGAAWPIFGPLQFKWYEAAPYMVRPTFGVVTHQIFMNLDKWNALSDQEKKVLAEEGRKLEEFSYKYFSDKAANELATMEKAGAKYTDLGEKQKAALGETWANGVWALAAKLTGGGESVTQLRALLRKHNLTH